MKRTLLLFAAAALLAAPAMAQSPKPEPVVVPFQCAQEDCPILKGAPQTAGMRNGFVRLTPGATVGWHTTAGNEETLTILHGQGEALIEGRESKPFTAPAMVYIPPATRHNVKNTGAESLEYVWVVAPAKGQ